MCITPGQGTDRPRPLLQLMSTIGPHNGAGPRALPSSSPRLSHGTWPPWVIHTRVDYHCLLRRWGLHQVAREKLCLSLWSAPIEGTANTASHTPTAVRPSPPHTHLYLSSTPWWDRHTKPGLVEIQCWYVTTILRLLLVTSHFRFLS